LIAFDETPSIYVNDLTGTITSKQIKAAYPLTECFDYISAVCLFVCRKLGDESSFFSVGVSTN
jgi:hypothetical protein